MEKFPIGALVFIHSLDKHAVYNGAIGTVSGPIVIGLNRVERISIKLPNKTISLKLENVVKYTFALQTKTDLIHAIGIDDLNQVKKCLEKKCLSDINTGVTPLSPPPIVFAAYNGNLSIIKVLVEYGACIDLMDDNNSTVLHTAVLEKQLKAVELLIELGADINAQDDEEDTCMTLAVKSNQADIVNLLAIKGASIQCKWFKGTLRLDDPVFTALQLGTIELKDPMMIAISLGFIDVVKMLYKHGVDMNSLGPECTLTDFAKKCNCSNSFLKSIQKLLNKLTYVCNLCERSHMRMKLCGRCKKVRYCSRECQLADFGDHKKQCHKK
jgi:hypothetical protein